MKSNIVLLDIETAPNIAYVWGAWKQNVGHNQWVEKSHIMSFAAKTLGDKEVYYAENRKSNDKKIIKDILRWLDKADIVVGHNSKKFDIPIILGRAAVHGLKPPSPFHQVDTLAVARREFRFAANSLAFLSKHFGIEEKGDHAKFPGFELWLECLRNNDEAWEEMKQYNIQDVETLEELYLKMRPYIKNHPHVVRLEDGVFCPKCGSNHINYRGYYTTPLGTPYRKFVCKDCGAWSRVKNLDKEAGRPDGRNTG